MQHSNTLQRRPGEFLRTNRLAILLEILAVFLPLYMGLIISDRSGSQHIPLGGDLALKGAPVGYLGLIVSLVALWATAKLRGAGWADVGLARPVSWFRTVLMGLAVALAVLGAVVLVINPVINALPNFEPRDMSAFGILTGNLPNLIINIVAMWFTTAFLEELLWRGYLINRLTDLLHRRTKLAWVIALVGSAVVFGWVHSYQGPVGIFKVGAVGLVLGLSYLAVGRNLWPLIIAHALFDSLDFVGHYLGG